MIDEPSIYLVITPAGEVQNAMFGAPVEGVYPETWTVIPHDPQAGAWIGCKMVDGVWEPPHDVVEDAGTTGAQSG